MTVDEIREVFHARMNALAPNVMPTTTDDGAGVVVRASTGSAAYRGFATEDAAKMTPAIIERLADEIVFSLAGQLEAHAVAMRDAARRVLEAPQ